MKRTKLAKLSPAALAIVGVFLGRGAHATTEITFGGFTTNNGDISTYLGYGSNVGASSPDYNVSIGAAGILGTPGIGLTWGAGYQTYTGWDGRGEVAQTDYNASASGPIDLVFTPSVGSGVLVNSFVLDNYTGGGKANVSWDLFDLTGPLASGVFTQNGGLGGVGGPGGQSTILTGLTSGDVNIGAPVTLRLVMNAGFPSYLALDNLVFDQVPEPSTVGLGLLGAGLGALALRRRKQA